MDDTDEISSRLNFEVVTNDMEDSCESSETVYNDMSPNGDDNSKTQDENATYVECELCFKRYKYRGALRAHKRKFHTSQPKDLSNKCKLCNKIYTKESSLNHHICNTHTDSGRMVKCNICPKTCRTMKVLIKHKYNFHNPVQCAHCDKIFKAKNTLRAHIQWHHPTDNKIYECVEKADSQICHKVFRSEIQLKDHICKVHTLPEEAQKCELCLNTFKSPRRLNRHMDTVHCKPDDGFVCNICEKKFVSQKYLTEHLRTIHTSIKQLQEQEENRTEHMKSIHLYFDFMCDTCEMILESISAYKDHKLNCGSNGFNWAKKTYSKSNLKL